MNELFKPRRNEYTYYAHSFAQCLISHEAVMLESETRQVKRTTSELILNSSSRSHLLPSCTPLKCSEPVYSSSQCHTSQSPCHTKFMRHAVDGMMTTTTGMSESRYCLGDSFVPHRMIWKNKPKSLAFTRLQRRSTVNDGPNRCLVSETCLHGDTVNQNLIKSCGRHSRSASAL